MCVKHLSLIQQARYVKLRAFSDRNLTGMTTKIISTFITVFLLLTSALPSRAFETDQFNLPPEPLADIGDEVSDHIAGQLKLAVEKLNEQIAAAESCLAVKKRGCEDRDVGLAKIEYLRSERALAKTVYDLLAGGNLMTTKFGKWIHEHKFRAQPSSYKAPYLDSIYLIKPSDYLTLSPTIRMYGHEFGIDKLEHLFQQGHQYYEIVSKALDGGRSLDESVKKAIDWGKKTERTYYGILTSGVYSNADLNANFIGLKFYQGLASPVRIGDSTRPAMVELNAGKWHLADSDTMRQQLLRPLIGEHLSEAYNPSAYRFTLVGSVKRAVKKNACGEWHQRFPTLTAEELDNEARSLELWHREDYGHTKRGGMVNIGEICFAKAS